MRGPRRRSRPAHPVAEHGAPPRLVDPILAAWEAFDSRRRHIRPLRPDGILGIERARLRRRVLVDGVTLRPGSPLGEMHLLNDRLRDLETRAGLADAYRQARADLQTLAAEEAAMPERERLAAFHGNGIMARFAERDGWDVRPKPDTPWQRVEDWYFRWLLVHWTPDGRERLRHGRRPLRAVDAWMSADALQRRYGRPGGGDELGVRPEPTPGPPGA